MRVGTRRLCVSKANAQRGPGEFILSVCSEAWEPKIEPTVLPTGLKNFGRCVCYMNASLLRVKTYVTLNMSELGRKCFLM